jgi:hypothetical protein
MLCNLNVALCYPGCFISTMASSDAYMSYLATLLRAAHTVIACTLGVLHLLEDSLAIISWLLHLSQHESPTCSIFVMQYRTGLTYR